MIFYYMATVVGTVKTLRLDLADTARLAELARSNDRSVSAEVRRAIRFYLRAVDRQEAVRAVNR